MRPPRAPFTALVFLFLLAWSSLPVLASPYTADSIVSGSPDFDTLAARFEELARIKGGVYAFETLRQAKMPPNIDMHLLGHKIGDILYVQQGIEGISLCTDEFRNACSHTMVIGALTDYGESALPGIRAACKEAPGGPGAYTMCYHGLGHGVIAYYDYSVPETVAMCEKTGTEAYREREAIECIGGAVMELSGGGGHDRDAWLSARAQYIDADPVGFCLSELVPDHAKEICLTYMTPELWKKVGIDMGHPNPRQYADAFALCDAIPETDVRLRNACYGGFGKEFIPLAAERDIRMVDRLPDEKYGEVLSWCGSAGDEEGVIACMEHALQSLFWGGENDPAASFRFCALPERESMKARCHEVLAKNIAQYFQGEERARWCSALPTRFQDLCA